MSDDLTAGIPNPDKPGHWLVPPWATNASFNEVVRHFLRFNPCWSTDARLVLAYFEGYQAALKAARTNELIHAFQQRWADDMHDCVGRCVRIYQQKFRAEPAPAADSMSTVQTLGRVMPSSPVPEERAS